MKKYENDDAITSIVGWNIKCNDCGRWLNLIWFNFLNAGKKYDFKVIPPSAIQWELHSKKFNWNQKPSELREKKSTGRVHFSRLPGAKT